MSKKRKIKLKRGKFYASYPNGGHPSLIYRKNRRKNKYDAIVFGTSEGHHRIRLTHPVSSTVKVSVIHSRPIRGVRLDFGDRELINIKINKSDKPIIESVKRKEPQKTRKYKERESMKKSVKPQWAN